jgi:hypothetical protein
MSHTPLRPPTQPATRSSTHTIPDTDDSLSDIASSLLPVAHSDHDVRTYLFSKELLLVEQKHPANTPDTSDCAKFTLYTSSGPISVSISIPDSSSHSSSSSLAPTTPCEIADEDDRVVNTGMEEGMTYLDFWSTNHIAKANVGFEWQLVTMSKYTTGVVTVYGWEPVENAHWDIGEVSRFTAMNSVVENEEKDHSAEARKMVGGNDIENMEMPWLDNKYLEYNEYVRYVRGEVLMNAVMFSDASEDVGLGLITSVGEQGGEEAAMKHAAEYYSDSSTNCLASCPTWIPENVTIVEIVNGQTTQPTAMHHEADRSLLTLYQTKPNTGSTTPIDANFSKATLTLLA